MPARFVNIDRDTPLLLPPDLRQWVTDAPNDKEQLAPTVRAVPAAVREQVGVVLADNGFYSAVAVARVEANGGPTVYAAVEKTGHHRSVSDLEQRPEPLPLPVDAGPVELMRQRLRTSAGRVLYRLRQQTVEPVFGIIKEAMGFSGSRCGGRRAWTGNGSWCVWRITCVGYTACPGSPAERTTSPRCVQSSGEETKRSRNRGSPAKIPSRGKTHRLKPDRLLGWDSLSTETLPTTNTCPTPH